MIIKKAVILGGLVTLWMVLWTGHALANKSSVSIQAPPAVQKGSEVVVRVTVTHNANNLLHYTDWVYVVINGKEIARWTYTSSERPEAETFTKEVKFTATENLEIKAEANCNLHGSAGLETVRVQANE